MKPTHTSPAPTKAPAVEAVAESTPTDSPIALALIAQYRAAVKALADAKARHLAAEQVQEKARLDLAKVTAEFSQVEARLHTFLGRPKL